MSYATIADLYRFEGKLYPPSPALSAEAELALEVLLENASEQVDRYLRLATYDLAKPADAKVIARATCAQAIYFRGNPGALSETVRTFDSIRAGSITLSTNAGSAASKASSTGTDPRSPRAIEILRTAGLYRVTARS
jgi:phage gp36-like protein